MKNEIDFSLDHPIDGKELLSASGPLRRSAWLLERIRKDDLFLLQDGAYSQLLFAEVLNLFVSGHFIATTVLAFSFIERAIAGRLSHNGEKSMANGSSTELLDAALRERWLTAEEHANLNELRNVRNPLIHFRDHSAATRPEVKAVLSAKTTEEQIETDAIRTLEAAIHVLNKTAI